MDYIPPQLGERRISVTPEDNGKWRVQVMVYKANKLRGDAYWVIEAFKSYAKKVDAERFASRFKTD